MHILETGVQWHNACKNILPADKQEVMISVNDIYYFTLYDCKMNVFRLRANPEKYFKAGEKKIYWIDFTH